MALPPNTGIKSDFHWAYTYVIVKIAWQTEHFSHWHELCGCHTAAIFHEDSHDTCRTRIASSCGLRSGDLDDRVTPTGCINSGRRAPELACRVVCISVASCIYKTHCLEYTIAFLQMSYRWHLPIWGGHSSRTQSPNRWGMFIRTPPQV